MRHASCVDDGFVQKMDYATMTHVSHDERVICVTHVSHVQALLVTPDEGRDNIAESPASSEEDRLDLLQSMLSVCEDELGAHDALLHCLQGVQTKLDTELHEKETRMGGLLEVRARAPRSSPRTQTPPGLSTLCTRRPARRLVSPTKPASTSPSA